uniref:ALG11_N domain-containing protein n=1 Tax=Angiostrongylus cantonensis TaxID=6313 RepID=A0A0K0CZN9_ANGCA
MYFFSVLVLPGYFQPVPIAYWYCFRKQNVIAFFHPYCNAGGGGERVLWCAIRSMQQKYPHLQLVVYSGDRDATMEQILLKAKQRFGIRIAPRNVTFVFLRLRRLVEADLYPCFTLLAQTMAGFVLGLEALLQLNPEVFIDSMGYSATLPLFRWIGGCRVAAYIHYPTISSDMIDLVSRREQTFNNADIIAQSNVLSHVKLLYYRLFAWLYSLFGQSAEVVMVNGRYDVFDWFIFLFLSIYIHRVRLSMVLVLKQCMSSRAFLNCFELLGLGKYNVIQSVLMLRNRLSLNLGVLNQYVFFLDELTRG